MGQLIKKRFKSLVNGQLKMAMNSFLNVDKGSVYETNIDDSLYSSYLETGFITTPETKVEKEEQSFDPIGPELTNDDTVEDTSLFENTGVADDDTDTNSENENTENDTDSENNIVGEEDTNDSEDSENTDTEEENPLSEEDRETIKNLISEMSRKYKINTLSKWRDNSSDKINSLSDLGKEFFENEYNSRLSQLNG